MTVKSQKSSGTLGGGRAAASEGIKPASRQLARLDHPEVANNKVAGEATFTL